MGLTMSFRLLVCIVCLGTFAHNEKPFDLWAIYIRLALCHYFTSHMFSSVSKMINKVCPICKALSTENLCLGKQLLRLLKFTAQDLHKMALAVFCLGAAESNLLACVKFD